MLDGPQSFNRLALPDHDTTGAHGAEEVRVSYIAGEGRTLSGHPWLLKGQAAAWTESASARATRLPKTLLRR